MQQFAFSNGDNIYWLLWSVQLSFGRCCNRSPKRYFGGNDNRGTNADGKHNIRTTCDRNGGYLSLGGIRKKSKAQKHLDYIDRLRTRVFSVNFSGICDLITTREEETFASLGESIML